MTRFSNQALLGLLLLASTDAFQPGFPTQRQHVQISRGPTLHMSKLPSKGSNGDGLFSRVKNMISTKVKPFGSSLLIAFTITQIVPQVAQAATPLPKQATLPDAEKKAMNSIQMDMQKKQQKESEEYNKRARDIEAAEGSKAREVFEKEYKEAKEARDDALMADLEKLQRELLDQGIDPFNDMEGYRQCFLLKTGRNLADFEGTDQFADAQMEKMGMKKQTYAYQKAYNRQIIKTIVEDYKTRGIDPLPEFANKDNHNAHAQILYMPNSAAKRKLSVMQENLRKYGQIEAPKGDELSVKEMIEKDPDYAEKAAKKLAKAMGVETNEKDVAAAAKVEFEAEKAKLKAEKAKLKAEKAKEKEEARMVKEKAKEKARIAKEKAKEETRAKKEMEKEEKRTAKEAAKAAAALAAATATPDEAVADAIQATAESGSEVDADSVSLDDFEDDSKFEDEIRSDRVVEDTKQGSSLLGKAAGLVAVAVGGKFIIGRLSQPSAIDEEERKRQFKLLMGITDEDGKNPDTDGAIDTKALDVVDTKVSDLLDDVTNGDNVKEKKSSPASAVPAPPVPEAITPPAPKKRLGIKSVFSKKNKNDRETDLNALIVPGAQAPEVAMMLAKLLTFGAPGRFPQVNALPGDMPMEEFSLESATDMLENAVEKVGISKEEGAEVFANVVNCMLIHIIDLASAALGENESVTFDAINIVIDFMNHAASLYDAVAEDVEIKPVTYGGNLPKSVLEQMYGTYAFSGIMKMEDDMNDRVELLRNVFSISEKKAEGIVMKASQKTMMEKMKTEEGRKEMESLMGGMMGGMEGMEGMDALAGMMGGGEGEEPSPEQLKQMLVMLKTMKDSGSIPPAELEEVRSQFRESFGSSIDDILKQADSSEGEMTSDDKELLDLMKAILED